MKTCCSVFTMLTLIKACVQFDFKQEGASDYIFKMLLKPYRQLRRWAAIGLRWLSGVGGCFQIKKGVWVLNYVGGYFLPRKRMRPF